jgi:hypothetical protein
MRDVLELAALHTELGPRGWRVWLTHTPPCWRAVVAPPDMPIPDAIAHGATQITADSADQLRDACAAQLAALADRLVIDPPGTP